MKDIARLVGVSTTTVSRYINAKYDFMSEETKDQIAKAIDETGYRLNKTASTLKTSKSGLIGFIIMSGLSIRTPMLLNSICEYSAKHNKKIVVVFVDYKNEAQEKARAYDLVDQQVDGLIVATGQNTEFYEKLGAETLPVVLLDQVPENTTLDTVMCKQYQPAYDASSTLISKGFERVLYVVTQATADISFIVNRQRAVMDACRDNERVFEKITINDRAEEAKNQALKELITRTYDECRLRRTVLFFTNGTLMYDAILLCNTMGLRYSTNFCICGYETWNKYFPFINGAYTITQPIAEMGRQAAELLFQRIDGGRAETPRHIELDCTII